MRTLNLNQMKKIALPLLLMLSIIFVSAQTTDPKIIEIKKIIELTPLQEQQIKDIYSRYSIQDDSILKNEQDPIIAAQKKSFTSKKCQEDVINLLSAEQKGKYITVITANSGIGHKVNDLKKIVTLTASQEQQIRMLYYDYSKKNDSISQSEIDPVVVTKKKKILNKKCQEDMVNLLDNSQKERYIEVTTSNSGIGHKITELKSIITLTPAQEQQIRNLYTESSKRNDSISLNENDPVAVGRIKKEQSIKVYQGVMSILTDDQKQAYVKAISDKDITARAEAKIQILRETNQYTEDQLTSMKTQIYNYLMLEQVVNTRDKYDENKRHENLFKLKQLRPDAMKEADKLLQLKAQGRIQNGSINW
jgi:Spy/CpxP family protein refolding chaperone